jgi:hypothetical protein
MGHTGIIGYTSLTRSDSPLRRGFFP